jgi:hypothetical protein
MLQVPPCSLPCLSHGVCGRLYLRTCHRHSTVQLTLHLAWCAGVVVLVRLVLLVRLLLLLVVLPRLLSVWVHGYSRCCGGRC